jgi:hypothetical protein
MPEVTNEELGRRIFQLQKEKAVEEVIEKIRHSLGDEWYNFSASDKKTLSDVLGETWVSIDRSSWSQCAFSRLTREDLEEIVIIGKELGQKQRSEQEAIDEVFRILSSP